VVAVALATVACAGTSTGSTTATTVNRSGSTTRPKTGTPGIVGSPFANGSPATAAGQPGPPASTAPATGGPGAGTAPAATTPAPPPQGLKQVGDVCSPDGATAYTDTGRLLICGTKGADGQLHWRAGRG
jgi:hypothetical protein